MARQLSSYHDESFHVSAAQLYSDIVLYLYCLYISGLCRWSQTKFDIQAKETGVVSESGSECSEPDTAINTKKVPAILGQKNTSQEEVVYIH